MTSSGFKEMANRGRKSNITQFTKDIHLSCMPARDKKLSASVDSLDTHDSRRRDGGGSQDSDFEWRSTPDVMSFKQSINFECSNAIPINFSEAWSYFQTCDLSTYRQQRIEDRRPSNGKLRCKLQNLVVGAIPLVSALIPERDLIFSITSCPMINESSVHRRVLQSIYVFMTKKPACPRYGNHWEEIGFQGQDPASDLRGVGMFGALQMLYLSSSQETKETLAPEIFELSRHPIHQFPLAVLSLNVTKMTLDAFRDGLLNRFCHKEGSAIFVVNQFYLAIMYRIYRKWKDKRMTIHDSCYLLKAVEKWCRTHPKKTFERLYEYISQFGIVVSQHQRRKGKKKKIQESHDETNLSWLDLTKPSLEVFI
ncbi:ELMO domain-containing protein 3 isoform X2 [Folsomia candida]|uniref:ELMO domain-containing protein 3 isoform X2 n=1 Tax=Folsomia candida TaxID=158441 RepID=UPI000B9057BC|nr:ELMO domain-containing protein 3 isoform X2 [Folsomia candida]